MHIRQETFVTIFLSPAELGQLTVEIEEMAEDVDFKKYPAVDRLTDAIAHRDVIGNDDI